MRVKAKPADFDLWELFVHDSDHRVQPYDQARLAEQLSTLMTTRLTSQFDYVRFSSEDHCGLDRWLVEWREWEKPEGGIKERVTSVAQAKSLLPPILVKALDGLNREVVTLEGGE
jgi:hypothetical protein